MHVNMVCRCLIPIFHDFIWLCIKEYFDFTAGDLTMMVKRSMDHTFWPRSVVLFWSSGIKPVLSLKVVHYKKRLCHIHMYDFPETKWSPLCFKVFQKKKKKHKNFFSKLAFGSRYWLNDIIFNLCLLQAAKQYVLAKWFNL